MAYAVPEVETDEDIERARLAEVQWWRNLVSRILSVQFEKRGEADALRLIATRMTATGQAPNEHEQKRIKELAWKYRRQLPKEVAPKLPPHDPIVQEMERGR